jgi:hypothetical protein
MLLISTLLPCKEVLGLETAFENGIMFASNDRVERAAAGMILGNVSVFCNGRIDNGIYFWR